MAALRNYGEEMTGSLASTLANPFMGKATMNRRGRRKRVHGHERRSVPRVPERAIREWPHAEPSTYPGRGEPGHWQRVRVAREVLTQGHTAAPQRARLGP